MPDQPCNSVRRPAQDNRTDVSRSTLSRKDIFDVAVRNFERKLSEKFQMLVEFKDGISDLRAKGASYRKITQILTQAGVQVSHDTVARFCRVVIGKTQGRPGNRQKSVRAPKAKATAPPAQPQRKFDAPNDSPPVAGMKVRGPRIADPKNV